MSDYKPLKRISIKDLPLDTLVVHGPADLLEQMTLQEWWERSLAMVLDMYEGDDDYIPPGTLSDLLEEVLDIPEDSGSYVMIALLNGEILDVTL